MNEIEKMYKNVKLTNLYCGDDYIYEHMLESECVNGHKEKCKTCDKVKIYYPPFTAEKQIEITKFLISKYARFKKFRSYEQKDLYMVYYECRYFPKQYLPFGEALAESINYLWQSLTEKEKQQITDILK